MVTNVKMEVTPDLSKRIQEIVFANEGKWSNKSIKLENIKCKYLFLEYKTLRACDNEAYFEIHKFKKISPYDFIASQGQQEWLPKVGEECNFTGDSKVWQRDTFIAYKPTTQFSYFTKNGCYKFCYPLSKTKIITIDNKDIEISEESFESLKQQLCKG